MTQGITIPIIELEAWLEEHDQLVTTELAQYLGKPPLYWVFDYVTGEDYPFTDPVIGNYWPYVRAHFGGGDYRDVALVKLRRALTMLGVGFITLPKPA